MATARITRKLVESTDVDPSGGRVMVFDTEVKGFGLVVLPTGIKSFIYRYKTPEGRERRLTIGKASEWTPVQARARAEELRRKVREGLDPLAEKAARRRALDVGTLLDLYLDSARFREKAGPPGRSTAAGSSVT